MTANLPAAQPGIIYGGALLAGIRGASVSLDSGVATYRCGLTAQTLYSTAAAVVVEIVGSATKTIRVKKISIWGQVATKFFTELTLLRATTVSGTGVANVPVIGKSDPNDATATAVINNYTGAATSGTGAAIIGASSLACVVPSATAQIGGGGWDFRLGKGIVLRGVADVLEVYNNILALGAGTYGFDVEWEEDAS